MRVLIVVVLMLRIVAVYQAEAGDSPSGLPFPQDVVLGMSSADLQKARPTVKMRDHTGEIGMFGAVEIIPLENGVIAGYVYHFKDGKLGAITYNRTSTNMLADVETKRLYRKLISSLGTSATMRTARAGQVLTVKHWEDAKAKVNVYLEATTQGTTVTLVSPAVFAAEELFTSASERDKQSAILGKRESLPINSDHEETRVIDRLSSDAPAHYLLGDE